LPGRSVYCLANLRKWALVFSMYTEDNNGCFFNGEELGGGHGWLDATRHSWRSAPKILRCPNATKPGTQVDRSVVGAWKTGDDMGSYDLNGWVCNPREGKTLLLGLRPAEYCWRSTKVEDADNVPLFLDAMWFEGWPMHTDRPRPAKDWLVGGPARVAIEVDTSEMNRFCIDRHEGHVNVLFMDYSVRKVGLKELWTLKWHRNYIVDGPWTKAGGVLPTDWPLWMKEFREY